MLGIKLPNEIESVPGIFDMYVLESDTYTYNPCMRLVCKEYIDDKEIIEETVKNIVVTEKTFVNKYLPEIAKQIKIAFKDGYSFDVSTINSIDKIMLSVFNVEGSSDDFTIERKSTNIAGIRFYYCIDQFDPAKPVKGKMYALIKNKKGYLCFVSIVRAFSELKKRADASGKFSAMTTGHKLMFKIAKQITIDLVIKPQISKGAKSIQKTITGLMKKSKLANNESAETVNGVNVAQETSNLDLYSFLEERAYEELDIIMECNIQLTNAINQTNN